MTSTVKKWLAEKSFGFIANPDGGKDIFVHYTDIVRSPGQRGPRNLRENEMVEFDLVSNGDKGVKAVNVRQWA
jgi:cold shock protein